MTKSKLLTKMRKELPDDLINMVYDFIKPVEQSQLVLRQFKSNLHTVGYDGDKRVYWYNDGKNIEFTILDDLGWYN
jgi:hypothetical protein